MNTTFNHESIKNYNTHRPHHSHATGASDHDARIRIQIGEKHSTGKQWAERDALGRFRPTGCGSGWVKIKERPEIGGADSVRPRALGALELRRHVLPEETQFAQISKKSPDQARSGQK